MGKTAIITGATRGIGKCFALECAKRGYDLFLIARNEKLLEECAQAIESQYRVNTTTVSADLSRTEDVKYLAAQISKESSVSLLINNAGFAIPSFFADSDIEEQLKMVRVHDEAMLRLTRAVLPIMKENKSGSIIHVASTMAYLPFVTNSVYCASKAFINTFSNVLQREVRGYGITIQALNPGLTKTDFHNTDAFEKGKGMKDAYKAMTPEDVVNISFEELGKKLIVVPGLGNKISLLFKEQIANSFNKRKYEKVQEYETRMAKA